MSAASPSSGQIYHAIYDFSILPIGLGSILGWNIKQCIRARDAGKMGMDVHLVAGEEPWKNFFQPHINEKTWEAYLLEVIWAYSTNPMMRHFYIHRDREDFEKTQEQIRLQDEAGRVVVEKYREARQRNTSREEADKLLIEYCEGYKSIFEYHDRTGEIPHLIEPRGCDLQARAFRERIGRDKYVVTTNFRMGSLAVERAEDADYTTSSTFSAWYDFFKLAERKFPDVIFLVLGKLPEIPRMCLDLKNVISPRHCGLNLGHELSLIMCSDLFLGAASGFASMAWFNDVTFVVTGLNKEGYAWVGYEFGIERYNFSKPNQRLVFETESVPMLLKYFGPHYQEWKRGRSEGVGPGVPVQKQHSHFLLNCEEEIRKEVEAYVCEWLVRSTGKKEGPRVSGLIEALDSIQADYPDVVKDLAVYHLARALALVHGQRILEATDAIHRARELDPSNSTMREFQSQVLQLRDRMVVPSGNPGKGDDR